MTEPLYTVEREFPVTIDVLWKAWTDPVQLEAWYHPVDLSVVRGSVVSDPVVGGWWTVGVDVPSHGFVAYFYGRYTEVDLHRRLVHTLAYTQSEAEFAQRDESAPHHVIALDFEDRGASSWVRFTQIGEMPAEQVEATRQGTSSYFDSLEQFLLDA